MSQRGETAFVAMRVGRIHDPREVIGLARELKCRPIEALAYVLLWEEFILEVGDALTGRVRGYTADHIAAKLTFRGRPAKLVEAMEHAGILAHHRTTFFHPYWLETPTGQYALQRAERREYDREKKRRQRLEREAREGAPEANGNGGGGGAYSQEFVSPGNPQGHGGDSPWGPRGSLEINQSSKGSGGASRPPNPPPSGGGLGSARWEWMKENHKRLRNPRVCMRYLDAMTDEDWRLCQWVVTEAGRPGVSSLSQKKRVLKMNTHKFLSEAAYLEYRPEWLASQVPREVTSLVKEIEITDRERKEAARAFIVAQMSDPDLTEAQKERARGLWLAAHPGETLEVPN